MNDLTQPEDPKHTPEEAPKAAESDLAGSAADASLPATPPPPPSPYASENPQTPAPQDAQPYGAPQGQPVAPAMPHAAAQARWGAPDQQPYTGQQPGAFPYQQPQYGQQPPYGQYPYNQPPYPYAPQPPRKKKVWPWVLGACLLVILLTMGGCVGCVACSLLVGSHANTNSRSFDDNSTRGYDDGYRYGYGHDHNDGNDEDASGTNGITFSKAEIEDAMEEQYGITGGTAKNNRCTPGVYEVGVGKDIEPGLYYLEGSQTEESNYLTFKRVGNSNVYTIDDSVVYFGNYFTELEEGDLIAFAGISGAYLYPAPQEALDVSAPYQSGVYRVGIDIPEGTYKVTAQSDAPSNASQESAAYVMKDLDFNDDSILETKYVIVGGSQTITVSQGQYVELFAATMTPVE